MPYGRPGILNLRLPAVLQAGISQFVHNIQVYLIVFVDDKPETMNLQPQVLYNRKCIGLIMNIMYNNTLLNTDRLETMILMISGRPQPPKHQFDHRDPGCQ